MGMGSKKMNTMLEQEIKELIKENDELQEALNKRINEVENLKHKIAVLEDRLTDKSITSAYSRID